MTTLGSRIELADFFAETADPALLESADRGQTELLDYRQLYELWERQQWLTQELDFSQDREDWHGFPEEERFQRMYGLSSFFIGEQRVTDELGPMMRARRPRTCGSSSPPRSPTRHGTCASSTASTPRSGCSSRARSAERLKETSSAPQPRLQRAVRRDARFAVRRLAPSPDRHDTLVEAITLYHMVIEGMLRSPASTSSSTSTSARARCRGSCGASTSSRATSTGTSRSGRASCATWWPRTRAQKVIQRMLEEALPVADKVLTRPGPRACKEDYEFFGVSIDETRDFAAQALTRRLKVIGLVPASAGSGPPGEGSLGALRRISSRPSPAGRRRRLRLPHFGSS